MTASESAPAAPGIEIPDFAAPAGTPGLVESPGTPSSPNAWARFEFETGCGNEGTKVLVVEWDPTDDKSSSAIDDWDVSWGGKVPRARNQVKEADGSGSSTTLRVLVLIEDDVQVPSVVTIAQRSSGRALLARPMPAIYTAALGADVAKASGRRGVLHTQWAEKRLEQLRTEYDRELQTNSEGVGAAMAYEDLTWVVEHFGLRHPYEEDGPPPQSSRHQAMPPRSPVGGKLGEKLRGLKLATSPSELLNTTGQRQNPHYFTPGSSGTTAPGLPRSSGRLVTGTSSGSGSGGVASLDAMVKNNSSGSGMQAGRPPLHDTQATEDELFALPMSPRSPEMEISPFSLIK
ncbi:hypothetical protein LQW54_013576 [Pestalotiopsis sp. IQ-011]